jgi:hypothetical protein
MDTKRVDPRWQEGTEFLQWFRGHSGKPDEREFVGRIGKYFKTLEEIAANGLSPEDRSAAQEILDEVAVQSRAQLPQLLHAAADLAASASEPDIREQARNILREVTRQLPPASEKLQ